MRTSIYAIGASDVLQQSSADGSGPPATPTPTVAPTSTETVSSAYSLAEGGEVYVDNASAFFVDQTGSVEPSIDNAGTIIAESSSSQTPVDAVQNSEYDGYYHDQQLINEASGSIYAMTSGGGSAAAGFYAPSWSLDVFNYGLIQSVTTGLGATAYGALSYSSYFTLKNTGNIIVWASAYSAYGAVLKNGGDVENSGSITVTAADDAYGVWADRFDTSDASYRSNRGSGIINNTGTITVSSVSGTSYGVAVSGLSEWYPSYITNSGTITANTAIYDYNNEYSPAQYVNLVVDNSGTINGDINLTQSQFSFTNTGVVNGNFTFDGVAGGTVSLDSRYGVINGNFDIGYLDPGYAENFDISVGAGAHTFEMEYYISGLLYGNSDDNTIQFTAYSNSQTIVHNADDGWTINYNYQVPALRLFGVSEVEYLDKTVNLGYETSLDNFYGDDKSEVVIESASGNVVLGEVGAGGQLQYAGVGGLGSEWTFVGSGDFLGAGTTQFLIESTKGEVDVGDVQNGKAVYTQVASLGDEWSFVGSGDFLNDGRAQFLIESTSGALVVGEVGSTGKASFTQIGGLGPEWKFVGVGDYLGKGFDQFLMESQSGAVVVGNAQSGAAQYTQVGALGAEWSFHS